MTIKKAGDCPGSGWKIKGLSEGWSQALQEKPLFGRGLGVAGERSYIFADKLKEICACQAAFANKLAPTLFGAGRRYC
ncbi:MAG: hypothetical protein ACOH2R_26500, partial [Pseudomonas sp.]